MTKSIKFAFFDRIFSTRHGARKRLCETNSRNGGYLMQNGFGLLFFLLLSVVVAEIAYGQSCATFTGPTITAASCSVSAVSAALSSVNTDGTTVNIPSCPSGSNWSTGVTWTQTNSVQVVGKSSVATTDSHGNPASFNDNTVLIGGFTGAMFNISTAAGKCLRISGISIQAGTNATTNGILDIGGPSQNGYSNPTLRIDHNHFYDSVGGSIWGVIYGWIYGVVDHNVFDLPQGGVTNGFRTEHDGFNGYQNGHGSWAAAVNWGSGNAMYYENNTFNYASASDCTAGGRQVYRYNSINYAFIQAHEGPVGGCRSAEIYNNWVTESSSLSTNNIGCYYLRQGSLLCLNNTITGDGSTTNIQFHYDRSENPATYGHYQSAPPAGLGYAGSTLWSGTVNTAGNSVTWVSGTNFAGPGSSDG